MHVENRVRLLFIGALTTSCLLGVRLAPAPAPPCVVCGCKQVTGWYISTFTSAGMGAKDSNGNQITFAWNSITTSGGCNPGTTATQSGTCDTYTYSMTAFVCSPLGNYTVAQVTPLNNGTLFAQSAPLWVCQ